MTVDCQGLGYRLRQLESATIVRCGDLFTFDMPTSTDVFQDAFVVTIDDGSIARVVWEVDVRQDNGLNRGSFRREALFYRQGGAVQIEEPPHTPFTVRSSKALDVEYQLSSSSITFRVKAAGLPTRWKGCIHIYVI